MKMPGRVGARIYGRDCIGSRAVMTYKSCSPVLQVLEIRKINPSSSTGPNPVSDRWR